MWIHTKSSAAPAHYGIYHAKRLIQYCGQSLENVQFWLGEPSAENDQSDDEPTIPPHSKPDSVSKNPPADDAVTLIPPPWDLPPRQQALWRAVQQARAEGLSQRAIAHRLGITRNTVRKYVRASIVEKDEAETDAT